MIVNVWHPLSPVENFPLVMCDARSFSQADDHPTWLRKFGVSSNDGTMTALLHGFPARYRT